MGYKCQVSLTLNRNDYETLIEIARRSGRNLKYFIDEAEKFKRDDYIILYWKSIDWLPDCEEVRAIMIFMYGLREYRFIRKGEDNDDYEVCSHGRAKALRESAQLLRVLNINAEPFEASSLLSDEEYYCS